VNCIGAKSAGGSTSLSVAMVLIIQELPTI
jgi:hypothetical protein